MFLHLHSFLDIVGFLTHNQSFEPLMLDQSLPELFRIVINILGNKRGNHDPYLVRNQNHIAMIHVRMIESVEEEIAVELAEWPQSLK